MSSFFGPPKSQQGGCLGHVLGLLPCSLLLTFTLDGPLPRVGNHSFDCVLFSDPTGKAMFQLGIVGSNASRPHLISSESSAFLYSRSGTALSASVEQKVCPSLIVQPEVCMLDERKDPCPGLLSLLLVISPLFFPYRLIGMVSCCSSPSASHVPFFQ